jgi:ABC-type nitrate/sulfonate/bicarbonate transport system substrate-binding protein
MHPALRLAALGAIVPAAVAACGGRAATSGGSAPPATVQVVVQQGRQAFPIQVMQQQGIAAAHHLKLDLTRAADPQAIYTAIQAGNFDVAFGGWPTLALLRQKGSDVTVTGPVDRFTNEVLVRSDSPIRSFADLRGRRLGLYAGPTGTSTILFRLICVRFYGFDPVTAASVQYGAAPLLMNALDRGDLDAALILDPLIAQELETHRYRSVGNLGSIWQERTGQQLMEVGVAMRASWARSHASVARSFMFAYEEALGYLRSHPNAWTQLAGSVGIEDAQGVVLLRSRTSSSFMTSWNRTIIDQQAAFADEVSRYLGKVSGVPTTIPPGTFTTDYLSTR